MPNFQIPGFANSQIRGCQLACLVANWPEEPSGPENADVLISTFVAGGQSVRVNQPQASACVEEKLLAVSMSEMELKTGNSMLDRQSRPTSRAATKTHQQTICGHYAARGPLQQEIMGPPSFAAYSDVRMAGMIWLTT